MVLQNQYIYASINSRISSKHKSMKTQMTFFLFCLKFLERGATQSQSMQSSRGNISTAAVQTQRLTWTLTDICGSVFKGREKKRREKGEKKRKKSVRSAHTMHRALAWSSNSCNNSKVLIFRALRCTFFTQKTTHASQRVSSLLTVHGEREKEKCITHLSGTTSSWNQIGLQRAKQMGILKEYWLKYSGWFLHTNTQANPPLLQIQNSGHEVKQGLSVERKSWKKPLPRRRKKIRQTN